MSDSRAGPPRDLATEVGIVFQDPSSSFNPARHIGPQITEAARVHGGMGKRQRSRAAVDRLRESQVSSPELRMRQYPHELSGGMRQRAMIAMALMTSPALLIADEPTTALDVTVQAEVLRLLTRLNAEHGMAMLLISHDIAVVSALCDRVCVMYAGRIVEELSAEDLHARRVCHPYTRALLAASPQLETGPTDAGLTPLDGRPPRPGSADQRMLVRIPLLAVHRSMRGGSTPSCATWATGAARHAWSRPGPSGRRRLVPDAILRAAVGVGRRTAAADAPAPGPARGGPVEVYPGQTLGVVGESGSGKSTLAKVLVGQLRAAAGQVTLDGTDLGSLRGAALRAARRRVQLVPQDPYGSLDPRMTVRRALSEAIDPEARRPGKHEDRVAELLRTVALDPDVASRYPHEFSGGQRQRIAIARALAVEPEVIVADEVTSSLDASVQAEILNLLRDIQLRTGVGMVFITHDLSVANFICDGISVLYLGGAL